MSLDEFEPSPMRYHENLVLTPEEAQQFLDKVFADKASDSADARAIKRQMRKFLEHQRKSAERYWRAMAERLTGGTEEERQDRLDRHFERGDALDAPRWEGRG